MTRLFCLSLVVALASSVPITAQEKKDPPKNFTNSIDMKFGHFSPIPTGKSRVVTRWSCKN